MRISTFSSCEPRCLADCTMRFLNLTLNQQIAVLRISQHADECCTGVTRILQFTLRSTPRLETQFPSRGAKISPTRLQKPAVLRTTLLLPGVWLRMLFSLCNFWEACHSKANSRDSFSEVAALNERVQHLPTTCSTWCFGLNAAG